MGKKVQVVMLVEPESRHRLDALRIVLRASRARVGEMGWTQGGFDALEAANVAGLARVLALAERAGMTAHAYTRAYARRYQRETYPPGLTELEVNDDEVTGKPTRARAVRTGKPAGTTRAARK